MFLRVIVLQTLDLLSVSIVVRVVSIVLLACYRGFWSYKPLVLVNSRTINTVVKNSVRFAGLLINWSRPTRRRTYDIVVWTNVSISLLKKGLTIH